MSDQKPNRPEGNESPLANIAHPDFQPRRRTPWGTVDGRVISFISRKGGVGKTTSTVNLGAALALSGHTVLVVSMDPQCGVCRTLGVPPHELPTCLSEIFSGNQSLTDIVHPSPLHDLFFISPRILTLEEEESFLQALERDPDTLVREIDRSRHFYDTILIDCPPGLGAATRAALLASDSYLVPLQAEELCRDSVDSLLDFVDTFRERIYPSDAGAAGPYPSSFPGADVNRPLALEGIFLTMASTRTRMGRHVAAKVIDDFGDSLFGTSVPRATRMSEMALRGKPAVIFDRRSPGSRAYFNLADELVHRYSRSQDSMGLQQGSTIPDLVDPLGPQPDGDENEAGEISTQKMPAPGGLESFLADLGGSPGGTSALPGYQEPPTPEIVSLDDLLAEEERQGGQGQSDDEWDEGSWNLESEDGESIN